MREPCRSCGQLAPVRRCEMAEWPYPRHEDCLDWHKSGWHMQHDDHIMSEDEYALWRMSNPGAR